MKKNQSKISIKDIAQELGLSITTISFIINKKAKNRISDEVIQKVEAYIEKVGYKPNSAAQSLRTGKTKTIVFMVEDISDPFFSSVAKEMEKLAFDSGYKIIFCSTDNKKSRAIELISMFKDRQVDAYIITPPEDFQDEIEQLVSENQIVMLFDRFYRDADYNYVVLNNYGSTKRAVEYLKNQGFKNIAYVGLKTELSTLTDRFDGYKEAVREANRENLSLLISFDDVKSEVGNKQFEEFLELHPEIDAILFATNNLAITGLKILKKKNIQIPEDIGVITFDDRDLFELHAPAITVMSQPITSLAKEVISGTLKLLKRKHSIQDKIQIVLDGELIVRKSS
ncbi:LacI family transcriptional regulator [Gillisia sp. M10.2A]|uniref:LacI family transcriptional regulator n=1 Tax=Gillisia lutea TaxID=2909668 RepID=A0ABS9EGK2_9FLAO|nr:LacI family DNA-binding transcriptional regulator [Gillisia lutea]MCF4101392.1 LacI family transcriptional regulator [Gillisia lutea]